MEKIKPFVVLTSMCHIPSASVCIHDFVYLQTKISRMGVSDTASNFCYNTIHIATKQLAHIS